MNRETDEIYIETAHGLSPASKSAALPLGKADGQGVQTGQAAVIPRIWKTHLPRPHGRAKNRKESISFICVPIKPGNETIGALSVDRLFADSVR